MWRIAIMPRFQTVIRRARFVPSPFTAYEMQGFAQVLAFRDWTTDFFNQLKANNMSVVCSFSQELVQPPDNPAGGAV